MNDLAQLIHAEWAVPYIVFWIKHATDIAVVAVIVLIGLYAMKNWTNGWKWKHPRRGRGK